MIGRLRLAVSWHVWLVGGVRPATGRTWSPSLILHVGPVAVKWWSPSRCRRRAREMERLLTDHTAPAKVLPMRVRKADA